jgi:hypothetical protein
MNFRSTSDFLPPFRLISTVDEMTPYKVEVLIRLKAEFPSVRRPYSRSTVPLTWMSICLGYVWSITNTHEHTHTHTHTHTHAHIHTNCSRWHRT